MIQTARIPISATDTSRTLWPKLDRLAGELLSKVLRQVIAAARNGQLVESTPQPSHEGSYYSDDSLPQEIQLSPTWTYEKIVRYVRAYDHPIRQRAFFRVGDYRLEMGYTRSRHLNIVRISAADEAESPPK